MFHVDSTQKTRESHGKESMRHWVYLPEEYKECKIRQTSEGAKRAESSLIEARIRQYTLDRLRVSQCQQR